MMDNDEEKFYRKYDMQVRPSVQRLRRMKRLSLPTLNSWNQYISDEMLYQDIHTEEVKCADITMPWDRLQQIRELLNYYEQLERDADGYRSRLDSLTSQQHREQLARINNPMVQKAYEQYQILLGLTKE